jgi:endoglucanase
MQVILDPHDFGDGYGAVIGSANTPNAAFADFWSRLASHYAGASNVIFGLMNEPHDMPTEQWLKAANAAVAAIRGAAARNLILVPGNGWTGAHSWQDNWYGTSDATVMPGVRDPLHRFAFEVHQYMDADFSGTHETCERATGALAGVAGMTAWLRSHGFEGFLGEIGAGTSPQCLEGLDDVLDHLDSNADVWLGWTYWAAGPWWGDYAFSVEPVGGVDRPQMAVLRAHAP